jgi:Fe-S-cluster-containing dehydrogenase component
MKNLNRRNFLKTAAIGTTALTLGSVTVKAADKTLSDDRLGILIDTTVCVGCRHCEWACRTAHNLPTPDLDNYSDNSVYKDYRRPDNNSLTVVNEFENKKNPLLPVYVKTQCMHCEKPACVSACIVGALTKNADGSVTWDDDKCIGCRYCMVACQFQIPTYDWHKSIDPHIWKCDLCRERRSKDKLPACVEICPNEALLFGKRSEVLIAAKKKIKRNPDTYIDHIYGEHEIGGTSVMYISGKKFDELKMPPLGNDTAPGISEAIQHGIFAYFVPPVTLFALLGTMMWVTKWSKGNGKHNEDEKTSEENTSGDKKEKL